MKRKAIAIGFIPIIVVTVLFGVYLAMIPFASNQMNKLSCHEYSCLDVLINSNTSITGISVSLFQEPSACLFGPPGLPGGNCDLPSNFCTNINTEANTVAFSFQGVKEGHYWLAFYAMVGSNATRGVVKSVFVSNNAAYNVVANITGSLAIEKIGITSSTFG